MGTQSTWGVFRGAFSSSTFEPPVTMSEKPAPASMAGGSRHGAPRPREHNDGEETTTPQTAMQTGLMSTDTAIVAAEKAKELEFDAKKKHPCHPTRTTSRMRRRTNPIRKSPSSRASRHS